MLMESESDGNHSTEDESSKGQEELSPRPLSNSSDGVITHGALPIQTGPLDSGVVIQQIGDIKLPPGSSSGGLYNGSLVTSNTSSTVFHNGGSSYLHTPGNILFNGLNLGIQPLAFNPLRSSGGVLLGGSGVDMQMQTGQEKGLGSSAEDSSLQYSPYSGCVNGAEVKLEGVHTMAAQNGGSSVLTFSSASGALQLGGYSLVQVGGGVPDGDGSSLLNSDVGLPPLQLSSASSSSAITQQGTMPLNNVAVTSSNDNSFQQPDKLTMTSLHHSTVLYNMSNAGQPSIKKEPLEGGVYSTYHHGLHLDPSGQLSYTTPNSEEVPSSQGPASSTEVPAVSSSSPEPEVYTTLTVSTPLMAQTDPSSHHLQPSEYLGGHDVRGPPPPPPSSSHLMGAGMNSDYMNLSESKVGGAGTGGVNEMVRAMCGEMEAVEGKELAKLQTVQMEEDMADL